MAAFTERTIRTEHGTVSAYDHGAHVAQWVEREVPVVWISKRSEYVADKALRGGIPVCWPWFANGPHGDLTPSHGLVRTLAWTLDEHERDRLTWRLSSADLPEASRHLFPYEFESTMQVALRPLALDVSHTVTNVGAQPFDYEIALHTYLHVGDVRDVRIHGLDGEAYYDKVTGQEATQDGPLQITGEVDSIYQRSGLVELLDPTLERVLTIEAQGAGNVVVWNPGPEGAKQMDDFADAEWTQMVCIETANIGERAIALDPGASHRTSVTVAVHDLNERTVDNR